MDQLFAGDALATDQELISNNGWFSLRMFPDGRLGIGRTQTRQTMWVASAPTSPGGTARMQSDGNFVCYSSQGQAYWATGTAGHPGSSIIMQADGNLVLYDASHRALWDSSTLPDLRSPTIRYNLDGYSFNETSESWKELCRALPCFLALQWPGYATGIVEDRIAGHDVVIQWWKGWCPKFLGFLGVQSFPGGIGGEVGIYRRIPGKVRPAALPFLSNGIANFILTNLANLTDNDIWWPFPELGAEIEFTLTNPVNGARFFSAGPEKSYWLAKWMDDASYHQYQRDQSLHNPTRADWAPDKSHTPADSSEYVLDFSVNGKRYGRIPSGVIELHVAPRSSIGAVSRARDTLQVFVTDQSGQVRDAAWQPSFSDGWHRWGIIGAALFPVLAPTASVSRSNDKVDVFATAVTGAVVSAAWDPTFAGGWRGWWEIAGVSTRPGAAVAVASRGQDKLDIFVIGVDGRVCTAAWDPAVSPTWRGWWAIGNDRFPAGAPVHVASRSVDKLDLFATDNGGTVRTAAWEPGFSDGWHWAPITGVRTLPGAHVTTCSRAPDKLDVFVVGSDGLVYTAAWDPAVSPTWRGWWAIGNNRFLPGAPVHVVSRSPDKLDIFAADSGGAVRGAAWQPSFTDGWHGWWHIAQGRTAPGAAVTVVSRDTDKLDLFVVGTDQRIWTAAWEASTTDGWHGWWPLS